MNQQPHLLLIGGKDSSLRQISELDIDITLVQERANLTADHAQWVTNLVVLDEWRPELVEALARDLHRTYAFSAVLSFVEGCLLTASRIGQDLGIAHNPLAAVERSRDKNRMRSLLEECLPTATVRSRLVSGEPEALAFLSEVGRPIVLKPVDGLGSRGVALARDADDVAAYWAGDRRPSGCLAEEFVPGPEFSVETLTLDGRHELVTITEKVKADGTLVESGHQMPARLAEDVRNAMGERVMRLLDALGHRWGPAHTEMILGPGDNPVVIETHTRFGGDQIWNMVTLTTGRLLAAETAAAIVGVECPRPAAVAPAAAVRYLVEAHATVEAIAAPELAASIPGVVRVDVMTEPGARLGALEGSQSRQGFVVAVGDSVTDAVTAAEAGLAALDLVVSRDR